MHHVSAFLPGSEDMVVVDDLGKVEEEELGDGVFQVQAEDPAF